MLVAVIMADRFVLVNRDFVVMELLPYASSPAKLVHVKAVSRRQGAPGAFLAVI
jgi:hypothetical protein